MPLAWALALLAAAGGPVDPADRLDAWAGALPIDPRVPAEMQRFERELPEGYAATLAEALRRRMRELAVRRTRAVLSGEREPFIDVEFPEPGFPGTPPPDDAAREFEEGFLFTEFLQFVDAGDLPPAEVMRIYTEPEFRQEVSSRIGAITEQDGLSCVETTGVKALLSRTLACNLLAELEEPAIAAEHSQVVANPGGDDYQIVYFKESLKTFVGLPDGSMAVHYVHHTRAQKLGSLKKLVGKRKVRGSQEKAVELLRERLEEARVAAK